jgi:hypothetical protein
MRSRLGCPVKGGSVSSTHQLPRSTVRAATMSFFVGKRVVAVRCMSDEEMADQEWDGCRPTPTVLEFEDGSFVFAASDSSHTSPGVLAGELSTGDSIVLRAKRGKPLTMAAAAAAAAATPSAALPAALPAPAPAAAIATAAPTPAATTAAPSDQPWRRPGGLTRTAADSPELGLGEAKSGGSSGPTAPEAAAAASAALQALMRAEPEPEPEPEVSEQEGGGLAGLLSSLHGFLKADPEGTLGNKHFHEVDLDAWNAAVAADSASSPGSTTDDDDDDGGEGMPAPAPVSSGAPLPESDFVDQELSVAADAGVAAVAAAAAAAAAARRSVYSVDVGPDTEPELTPAQKDAESQLSVLETLHADGLLSDSVYEGQREKLEAQLELAADAASEEPVGQAASGSEKNDRGDFWARVEAEHDSSETAGANQEAAAEAEVEAAREGRRTNLLHSSAAAAVAGAESPPPPPLESESESE